MDSIVPAPTPVRPSLAVEWVPIGSVKPNPHNVRRHSTKQISQIARSMAELGIGDVILTDAHYTILGGHGRLEAFRKLGHPDVPVIRLHHFSDVQGRLFALAHNQIAQNASWDESGLGAELKILSNLEIEIELEVTGFETPTIDLMIHKIEWNGETTPDVADDFPPPSTAKPISQLGDLWLLGKHRLLCGNARDPAAYLRLMDDQLATMAITDVPYNLAIRDIVGRGAIKHREFVQCTGEMTQGEFQAFLTAALQQIAAHCDPSALAYCFIDWRGLETMQVSARSAGLTQRNLVVWTKDNGGMGSLYRSRHELIPVYSVGDAPHLNNVQLGRHGRNRDNVWNYAGMNSFARTTAEGNLLALHPTVKPVAMIGDAILDVTKRHDIVLDPFIGSGTTIIAAERTGRRGYGMDLDPVYIDTAIRRWQAFTGKNAVHAGTGEMFEQPGLKKEISNDEAN
jgi:DNA modification methylase